jgi:E3 SUMO-protein ligase PIAS1
MSQNRHTTYCNFNLTARQLALLNAGTNGKVFLFCASEPFSKFPPPEIAFPQQIELKVNKTPVKANFRGLKNKHGSTRPVDITDLVGKSVYSSNVVELTYALTQKVRIIINCSYNVLTSPLDICFPGSDGTLSSCQRACE